MGVGTVGKMGEGINRYKVPVMKPVSHGDVMYGLATIANNYYIAYLKVAWRVDLENSHHKKTLL